MACPEFVWTDLEGKGQELSMYARESRTGEWEKLRRQRRKRGEERRERKEEKEEGKGKGGREEGSTPSFRREKGIMDCSVSRLPPPLAPALAADSRPQFLDYTGTRCHVLKPWSCCLVLLS